MTYQSMISDRVMAAAVNGSRQDIHPGISEQGIGLIKAVRPAADILADYVRGARLALSSNRSE